MSFIITGVIAVIAIAASLINEPSGVNAEQRQAAQARLAAQGLGLSRD